MTDDLPFDARPINPEAVRKARAIFGVDGDDDSTIRRRDEYAESMSRAARLTQQHAEANRLAEVFITNRQE